MEDITRSQFRQVGQVMIEDCFDVPKIPGFWVLGVCTQRLASTKVWVVLLSILPQTLQDIRVELRIDSLTFGMNSKHKSPWKFKKQQAFSSCINLCDSKSSRLKIKPEIQLSSAEMILEEKAGSVWHRKWCLCLVLKFEVCGEIRVLMQVVRRDLSGSSLKITTMVL